MDQRAVYPPSVQKVADKMASTFAMPSQYWDDMLVFLFEAYRAGYNARERGIVEDCEKLDHLRR